MSTLPALTTETVTVQIDGVAVSATLTWRPSLPRDVKGALDQGQRTLDSEILRGCAAYVPFRTGMLQKSGPLGTTIGSGEVRWVAPYAKPRYYTKNLGSNGEALRGGYWFERWKNQNGAATVAAVKRMVGSRI